MTNTTKTSAQILWEAADLIEEHGWTRRFCRNPETGGMCARGGMIAALHGVENVGTGLVGFFGPAVAADRTLSEYLINSGKASHHYLFGGDVAAWNNFTAKDAQEVITTLRAAAISLDPRLADVVEPTHEAVIAPTAAEEEQPSRELLPV